MQQHELAEAQLKQKGLCAICKKEAVLLIDHCHDKIIFRGLLCGSCNLGLGHFKDTPVFMLRAILYVVCFNFRIKTKVLLEKLREKRPKLFHVPLHKVERTGQTGGQGS